MAKRRSVSFGGGLSNALNQWLYYKMIKGSREQTQQSILERQQAMDLLNRRQGLQADVTKGTYTPEEAERLLKGEFVPPRLEKLSTPVLESLRAVKTAKEAPTGQELQLQLEALDPRFSELGPPERTPSPAREGTLPSTQLGPGRNPALERILSAGAGKKEALLESEEQARQQAPLEAEFIGPEGTKMRRFGTQGEFEGIDFPVERTSEQEATRGATEAKARAEATLPTEVEKARRLAPIETGRALATERGRLALGAPKEQRDAYLKLLDNQQNVAEREFAQSLERSKTMSAEDAAVALEAAQRHFQGRMADIDLKRQQIITGQPAVGAGTTEPSEAARAQARQLIEKLRAR